MSEEIGTCPLLPLGRMLKTTNRSPFSLLQLNKPSDLIRFLPLQNLPHPHGLLWMLPNRGLFYIVVPETVPRPRGEAAPVQSRAGQAMLGLRSPGHCWLKSNRPWSRTPSSLSLVLPSSLSLPRPSRAAHPRCRIQHSPLLNFTQLGIAHL